MKATEAKQLLEKYFEAQTSTNEERQLRDYFLSGDADEDLMPYACLFEEFEEMRHIENEDKIEESVMEYILRNERQTSAKRFRQMWITVSGIAAMLLIAIGGALFYQQQQPYKDTFSNPEEAVAYAEIALQYISSKYNKGLTELNQFDKLKEAVKPLEEGMNNVSQGINAAFAIGDEIRQLGNLGNSETDF